MIQKTTSFRIRQDNMVVAKCEGQTAEAEILNYAALYRQDGEITIQHNAGGHWKRYALLCQWSLPEKDERVVQVQTIGERA